MVPDPRARLHPSGFMVADITGQATESRARDLFLGRTGAKSIRARSGDSDRLDAKRLRDTIDGGTR